MLDTLVGLLYKPPHVDGDCPFDGLFEHFPGPHPFPCRHGTSERVRASVRDFEPPVKKTHSASKIVLDRMSAGP